MWFSSSTKLFPLCVQAEVMLSFKMPGRSATSLLCSFRLTCIACTLVQLGLQKLSYQLGARMLQNTSLWLNHTNYSSEPEAQVKCLKLGQVCGETRTGVPCPLQEYARSALVLLHVAVGVCWAGSCIYSIIDHVFITVRVHSTKEQVGCMKHKCIMGAFLEGKNSSKYIGKRPNEELSLLNELPFSWHC